MNDLEKKMLAQLTVIQLEIKDRRRNYDEIEELERKIEHYKLLNERSAVNELEARTELKRLSEEYSNEGSW